MSSPRPASPDLAHLAGLFYDTLDALGEFEETAAAELPPVASRLLAHDEHMTVAVEAWHGCSVDVRVLATRVTPTHYSRKIVLTRQSDGREVLFGLVRLGLSFLADDVRREIESERTPLGRVLIEHNVLRHVRLLSLWRVRPADELRELFHLAAQETCFGRTALIYCNGVPAVELLEIVPPVEPPTAPSARSA